MYKDDLALDNLQWLICHIANPNQTNLYIYAVYIGMRYMNDDEQERKS